MSSKVISWSLHGLQSAWLQFSTPFEYLWKKQKLDAWKTLSVLRDVDFFFLLFFILKPLNVSFTKSGSDRAHDKFWEIIDTKKMDVELGGVKYHSGIPRRSKTT